MSTKHLLTISLLLPLVAISATAQAGWPEARTAAARSNPPHYWPSEVGLSVPIRAGSQTDVNSAFAYDRTMSRLEPATTDSGGSAWRYQGGPKGR